MSGIEKKSSCGGACTITEVEIVNLRDFHTFTNDFHGGPTFVSGVTPYREANLRRLARQEPWLDSCADGCDCSIGDAPPSPWRERDVTIFGFGEDGFVYFCRATRRERDYSGHCISSRPRSAVLAASESSAFAELRARERTRIIFHGGGDEGYSQRIIPEIMKVNLYVEYDAGDGPAPNDLHVDYRPLGPTTTNGFLQPQWLQCNRYSFLEGTLISGRCNLTNLANAGPMTFALRGRATVRSCPQGSASSSCCSTAGGEIIRGTVYLRRAHPLGLA